MSESELKAWLMEKFSDVSDRAGLIGVLKTQHERIQELEAEVERLEEKLSQFESVATLADNLERILCRAERHRDKWKAIARELYDETERLEEVIRLTRE